MKKMFALLSLAAVAAAMCSCQNLQPPKKVAPVVTGNFVSTAAAPVAPTTKAMGPVSTYRPLYSVDSTKILSAKGGIKTSEEAAKEDAVAQFIIENQCEDIFVVKNVFTNWSDGNVECEIYGYPVSVVGVDEIKTGIYEQAPDGTLKPMEKMEHKLVYKQPYTKEVKEAVKLADGTIGVATKTQAVAGRWEYTPFSGDTACQAPAADAEEAEDEEAPAKEEEGTAIPGLPVSLPVKLPFGF
ncbi:MAG: hypothetical protein ACI4SG_07890 [Oligosphaeraceae bacterium]